MKQLSEGSDISNHLKISEAMKTLFVDNGTKSENSTENLIHVTYPIYRRHALRARKVACNVCQQKIGILQPYQDKLWLRYIPVDQPTATAD